MENSTTSTSTSLESAAEMGFMEQIYSDFTTQMLPAIQEGLVITKDYFIDLFGRYVTFLIVVEVITIVLAAITIYVAQKMFRKGFKNWGEVYQNQRNLLYTDKDDNAYVPPVLFTLPSLVVLFLVTPILIDSLYNLAQVVFVPEIRVYQDLTQFMNNRP